MALFDPFGVNSEKRLPTPAERDLGFGCGPAQLALFNGLLHRIESEIGEVISFAGLTPSDSTFVQLREAIQALIEADTGSGETSLYLLTSQARARLPIYPEFLTADGKINVTSPATGTVRIPSGIQFMHRGIFPITTVETDFVTDASKTYHIRWNPTTDYVIEDLADSVTYNPGVLAETDVIFDSKYDDMLIARVITNSSNVATITNLENKDRLSVTLNDTDFVNPVMGPPIGYHATLDSIETFDWSRRPTNHSIDSQLGSGLTGNEHIQGVANLVQNVIPTRYDISWKTTTDFSGTVSSLYGEWYVAISA